MENYKSVSFNNNGDNPILSKVGDNWMFFDSQYLATIKLMLSKKKIK